MKPTAEIQDHIIALAKYNKYLEKTILALERNRVPLLKVKERTAQELKLIRLKKDKARSEEWIFRLTQSPDKSKELMVNIDDQDYSEFVLRAQVLRKYQESLRK